MPPILTIDSIVISQTYAEDLLRIALKMHLGPGQLVPSVDLPSDTTFDFLARNSIFSFCLTEFSIYCTLMYVMLL